MKLYCWLLIAIMWMMSSCEKDIPLQETKPIVETALSFKINYNVDGTSLIRDSVMYYNEAGNHYSIHNILFYLTKIRLTRSDGEVIHLADVHYVDGFNSETNHFTFTDLPEGTYTEIHFNIGVDSAQNIQYNLPSTMENINMYWPELMGGGFHFLRLEGYFTDSGNQYGYAMHTGTNDCLIPIKLTKTFTIIKGTKTNINLRMNINEWFRDPNIFDFNTDGNYIMGNLPAMQKLSANGHDVFSL